MNLLQNLDMEILRFIYNNLRNPVIDRVMIAFTLLGDLGVVWILISLFLLASKKYRKTGMMTICALILSTVLGSGILKYLIQRPRPFVIDPAVEILISKPLSYSFPSGHGFVLCRCRNTVQRIKEIQDLCGCIGHADCLFQDVSFCALSYGYNWRHHSRAYLFGNSDLLLFPVFRECRKGKYVRI